jgi:hypothetical protein
LLQDLTAGRRGYDDLSEADQQLLDRAVLDFSSPNRRPPEPVPAPPPSPKKEKTRYHKAVSSPIPGKPVPYWWLG